MKKTACILSCIILFFCACKKSATTSVATQKFGTISAVINGTQVNFDTRSIALSDNPGGYWYLDISGYSDASQNAAYFDILIDSVHGPIVPGVYAPGGSAGIKDSMEYSPQNNASNNAAYYNDALNTSYQSQVTITSNTDAGGVQGTFTGTLILSGSFPAKTITITDGKFSVPYQ